MSSSSLFVFFALAFTMVAADFAHSLTCHPTSNYLEPTPHGSQVGSYISPSSRCPRAKPTTTITSTITSGQSVVPTSSRFTPISSETYSATSTPNKDISSIFVAFDFSGHFTTAGGPLPSSLSCGPEESTTTSTIPSTCSSFSTVTTSTTVTSPSSVSYAACGTDNIVSYITDPTDDKQRNDISSLTLYNVTGVTGFSDIGVSDCCAACQTLSCAFGRWTVSPFAICELYFQSECDGKEWLGSTFNYNTPDSSSPGGYITGGLTVFNGPCGQIVSDGPTP